MQSIRPCFSIFAQAELRNQTQQLESSQQEMKAQARENARLQQELDNKRDELRILRKDCITPQVNTTWNAQWAETMKLTRSFHRQKLLSHEHWSE